MACESERGGARRNCNPLVRACEKRDERKTGRGGQTEVKEEGRKEGRKEREGAAQPSLQLGNKPLQPQRQPQLQQLARCVHYYLEQIYTAWLAHSGGEEEEEEEGGRRRGGRSKSERNEEKQGRARGKGCEQKICR